MEGRFCKSLPSNGKELADYTWSMYSFFGHAIALPRFASAEAVTLDEQAHPSPLCDLAADTPKTLRLLHVKCPSGEFVSDGGAILRTIPPIRSPENGTKTELLERLYKEKEICLLGNAVAVKLTRELSPDAASELLLGFAARAATVLKCLRKET